MPHRLPVFRLFAWTAATAVTVFTASAQAVDTPAAAPSQAPLPIVATPARKPAPLPYRSVFDSYQPFTDDKGLPWKDTNHTVQHIGGWRAYAKEAAADAPSNAAQGAVPNRTDPHAGHGKH